jgi:hypothetical protein
LGEPARRIAAELGYDDLEPAMVPETASLAAASPSHLAQMNEATQLLEQLDDLSDDEVAALLKENLMDEQPDD